MFYKGNILILKPIPLLWGGAGSHNYWAEFEEWAGGGTWKCMMMCMVEGCEVRSNQNPDVKLTFS